MVVNFYLTFDCPHCNRLFEMPALEVEVFHDGMEIICPKCEARLIIRISESEVT